MIFFKFIISITKNNVNRNKKKSLGNNFLGIKDYCLFTKLCERCRISKISGCDAPILSSFSEFPARACIPRRFLGMNAPCPPPTKTDCVRGDGSAIHFPPLVALALVFVPRGCQILTVHVLRSQHNAKNRK